MNFIRDVVERFPSAKPALLAIDAAGERRVWHFGELFAMSAGLSGAMAARGVRRGDVVMTLAGSRVEWVLALLACFRMGAVALPCSGAQHGHAQSVARLLRERNVDLLAEGAGAAAGGPGGASGAGGGACAVFVEAEASSLLTTPTLAEQHPGPSVLLLRCACPEELLAVAALLGRQLVAGMQMADGDTALAARLMPQLERMARHVNVNSFTSMPIYNGATAAQAVARFLRPVFYLDVPSSLLPAALQDGNPLQLWRQVDGEMRH